MDRDFINKLPIDQIEKITPVPGGDVNEAYRIDSKNETLFLLVQPGRSKDFFDAEAAGLKDFEKAGITAPKVIHQGAINGDAFLLLSYLHESSNGSQKALGDLVAKLHATENSEGKFGYKLPYHGGAISFQNKWTDTWREQFVEGRLDKLKDRIVQDGLWNQSDIDKFENVRKIIIDTLQKHKSNPVLVHGDLWAGNYMFLNDGTPALFDPSPLYADREFDLGATIVFGGFDKDFYDEYSKTFKLDNNAWFRINFYKLYLLLVHLLKFGRGYYTSVNRTMDEIIEEAN